VPERGRLITIEGIDGAGKSELARRLHEALTARGIDAGLLREPGGVELSERIRELVKDRASHVGARTEALLYAAARAQLVEQALVPLLEAGTWIVLDRFVDSSLAYQGGGRELGIDAVAQLNRFATGGLAPDRTLLLELDTAAARARAAVRDAAPDRLELEHDDFFERITAAYAELAAREPGRIRRLDATAGPDDVLQFALHAIADLLKGR
jgi:dTMP kinase